jgi:hypothetical protein
MATVELTISDLMAPVSPNRQLRQPSTSVPELRQACFNAILREYNPFGFAETMLAREISRCAAQMIRDEEMLDAAEEQAEQSLMQVVAPAADERTPTSPPAYIAKIYAPGRLDNLSRATARNSNALSSKLRQLMDLQRDRNDSRAGIQDRDLRFATESHCITYLARRIRLGCEPCRRCGQAAGGSWIAVRRCWECAACHAQMCVRHGTVMARSHVPLVNWFHAIRIVLHRPTISASHLAATIGIRRVPTVRSILTKTRIAMSADNASRLLADLDMVYLPAA